MERPEEKEGQEEQEGGVDNFKIFGTKEEIIVNEPIESMSDRFKRVMKDASNLTTAAGKVDQ